MIVYIHQENKMDKEPERYHEWILWKLRQEREKNGS